MAAAHLREVRCVVVDGAIIRATLRTLQQFGAHRLEGLVLWLGEVEPGQARVLQVFTPDQQPVSSEEGVGYFVSGETLFELNRGLAESGLRLIAQIHSHPAEAYHSDTDDRYAVVTADGGLSLVVPNFGRASADPTSWAVYRLDQGNWRALSIEEARTLFVVGGER